MSTGHTTTGCHPQLNKRSDQIHLHAPTTRYLCPFRPKHSRLNAAHRQGPSISFAITDVRYRPLLFWNVVKSVLCTCSHLPIRTKREEIPQHLSITIASSDRDAQASASFVASRQPVVGRSVEGKFHSTSHSTNAHQKSTLQKFVRKIPGRGKRFSAPL
jgi:hypothetical protein